MHVEIDPHKRKLSHVLELRIFYRPGSLLFGNLDLFKSRDDLLSIRKQPNDPIIGKTTQFTA